MGPVDRIAEQWGTRTPYGVGEGWPTPVAAAVTGIAEITGDKVLPLLRSGKAATVVDTSTDPARAVGDVAREPGVREQL